MSVLESSLQGPQPGPMRQAVIACNNRAIARNKFRPEEELSERTLQDGRILTTGCENAIAERAFLVG